MEKWKDVVGYEGVYEVSNQGRVRSRDHIDTIGRFRRGRVLKPAIHNRGYTYVNLYDARTNQKSREYIHRIVARAFIGEPPRGHNVDHINRVRDDNRLENLRYLTIKENCAQSSDSKCKSVEQLTKEGTVIKKFTSTAEASAETGINRACIYGALNGKCATAGGYYWRRV